MTSEDIIEQEDASSSTNERFLINLNLLEETNSITDKEILLTRMLTQFQEAETFFRLTFNDTVYGIQEQTFYNAFLQEYTKTGGGFQHVSEFLEKIEQQWGSKEPISVAILTLFCKELAFFSGDELKYKINKFFRYLTPLQKKWYSRAILHDLRAGVQVKTVNRVFRSMGKNTIEKFALQLSATIDNIYDEKEVASKLVFPCVMECKYDGIRLQAEIWFDGEKTNCALTSRRGTNRTQLHPEIVNELLKLFSNQNVILDGEIIADSFQKLTRKDDKSTRKYVIFDLLNDEKLPYINRYDNLLSLYSSVGPAEEVSGITEDFDNPIYNNNEKQRTSVNQEAVTKQPHNGISDIVILPEHYTANNIKELQDYFIELVGRDEEGMIIKLPYSIYERGSRKHMFKVKPVYTADLKIIGYKFGEGKRAGKVATLELIDASGNVRVDVGSGIDDDTCEELTNQLTGYPVDQSLHSKNYHPPFISKICEIMYSEKTETNSLRHPRFKCIREDKDTPDTL